MMTTKTGAESWRIQNVLEPIDTDVNEFNYADERMVKAKADETVVSVVRKRKRKRQKTKREKHKSQNEAKGLSAENH
jgi:hypothetical protein